MVLLPSQWIITLFAWSIHHHGMFGWIFNLELDGLLGSRRFDQSAYELEWGINSVLQDFIKVWHCLIDHNLESADTRSISKFHKGEATSTSLTKCLSPSAHFDLLIDEMVLILIERTKTHSSRITRGNHNIPIKSEILVNEAYFINGFRRSCYRCHFDFLWFFRLAHCFSAYFWFVCVSLRLTLSHYKETRCDCEIYIFYIKHLSCSSLK